MPQARSSLIHTGASRSSLTILARAVALQIGYSLLVPRRQLLATVNAARAAKARAARQRRHASIDEAAVAAAFYHAQYILPSADKCLPRSFAIANLLRRTGHHPTIVFGVQLPFAAHCWVQCEDRVVSDPLAHVASFTPILAI
ncbi:lasso peptide biosynthesis B2 protein [Sphingomonas sp. MMSM20]|uniref:lasso peptide biosynthesis B2 protein n=1 Tax=Sphingomonas lycopersici TaxID=2951807 RepID=UPI002237D854|nr:lasso peptide biosynthesis B2 protein [Sphingomonas lycopersici]MCW6530722.1 lasso peptide biosynthesis B2 protein [Sphingomonas lycopersici]